MDAWGPDGCRRHRTEIVLWLRDEAAQRSWWDKAKAGALAIGSGLAFHLDPMDPLGSIVDEAIRRATPAAPAAGPPPSRLIGIPQAGLARGDTGAMNASIIPYRGRLLMAYRAGVHRAIIHVAELDAGYNAVRSVPLALRHPLGPDTQEDPRLTTGPGGGLRVFFYGFERNRSRTTMLYADLSDDLVAGPVRHLELHGRNYPKEKNWSPYVHDGEQYVVYTISPHVILRIDGDRAERVHVSDTPFPWSGGHLRGGAPPVLVGDRYYHWFHGCALPGTSTPSDGTAAGSHYNVGLYTFEAKPPFRPLSMTPHPLRWGDRHANVTRDKCPYHAVVFPCGAYLDGDDFYVSSGENDRRIGLAVWSRAAVDAALIAVPSPKGAVADSR